MKLLNQSLKYLSVSIFFIISLWTVVFYFIMLNEIKESVDEGLENYKRQIVYKSQKDTSILNQHTFKEGFFAITAIEESEAITIKDRCIDTLIYMQDADDIELELEPVRMLTTAFENNGRYYKLKIINPMVEEDDLIAELLWQAVWLYLILLLSIIVINNLVLQRLWKPFYDFLQQLKSYRVGSNSNLPEVKTKTKEFTDLQIAVNTLLGHNLETYNQQKQFIGNASHELQTPLAIAINKLELLLENEGLADNQAESIVEVMNIIERLVRLNKSLLLLTKIENKQFLDNQSISMNKVVDDNFDDLYDLAAFKHVKLNKQQSFELVVEMDSALANIIIANLLRNAIFHNVNNGFVLVDISENVIKVSNSGKNEALNADKIFTRFYKSNNEQSNTGLGLAIVKAICVLYGFTISYQFVNNQHQFELRFNNC